MAGRNLEELQKQYSSFGKSNDKRPSGPPPGGPGRGGRRSPGRKAGSGKIGHV